MNEERIKILEMVEDKIINVEDAIRLLDAIKFNGPMPGFRRFRHSHPSCARADEQDFEAKFQKFAAQVDNFAKEVGSKMEASFKVMEPKLRKATQVVVEKTASVVNEISNALNESVKSFEEKNNNCGAGCEGGCEDGCFKPEEAENGDGSNEN